MAVGSLPEREGVIAVGLWQSVKVWTGIEPPPVERLENGSPPPSASIREDVERSEDTRRQEHGKARSVMEALRIREDDPPLTLEDFIGALEVEERENTEPVKGKSKEREVGDETGS